MTGSLIQDFETIALSALGDFGDNHTQSRPRSPTRFALHLFENGDVLHVSEDSRVMRGESRVTLNLSHAVARALAGGALKEKAVSRDLYALQVFWLVHHEIGHWVLGHNALYADLGWSPELGVSDTAMPGNRATGPVGLARAAELEADDFASRSLFHYLRTVETTAEDDDLERSCAVTLIAMLSVASLFYDPARAGRAHLHPDWPIRYQNAVLCVFNLFTARMAPAPRTTARAFSRFEREVLRRFYTTSHDAVILDRCRSAFTDPQGLADISILEWLFDPQHRAGADGDDIAKRDAFMRLQASRHVLADHGRENSPVHDIAQYFEEVSIVTSRQHEHEFRIATDLSEDQALARLSELCTERGLTLIAADAARGPALDELKTFIDVVVQASEQMSADAVKATFEYLRAGLRLGVSRQEARDEEE